MAVNRSAELPSNIILNGYTSSWTVCIAVFSVRIEIILRLRLRFIKWSLAMLRESWRIRAKRFLPWTIQSIESRRTYHSSWESVVQKNQRSKLQAPLLYDSTKPPSYAQVISKELVDTVKMVDTESWKKQESLVHSKTMLAVSGLVDNGNDLNYIQQIFSALNFSRRIISCARIGGRNKRNNEKLRIVKICLQSATDCNLFMTSC